MKRIPENSAKQNRNGKKVRKKYKSLPDYDGAINVKKIRLVFETGSSISYSQVDKHEFNKIPSRITIVSADGNVSQIMGLTEPLKVKVADKIVEMNLTILKNQHNDVWLSTH